MSLAQDVHVNGNGKAEVFGKTCHTFKLEVFRLPRAYRDLHQEMLDCRAMYEEARRAFEEAIYNHLA